MPGFNPWIDLAVVAAIWLPLALGLVVHEIRKNKASKALRGATRVSN